MAVISKKIVEMGEKIENEFELALLWHRAIIPSILFILVSRSLPSSMPSPTTITTKVFYSKSAGTNHQKRPAFFRSHFDNLSEGTMLHSLVWC